ncbi:PREDICTED: replication factor C subunit 5 isoform X2 [Ceratosolen solmsi marchali]|uniref:Activator 1 subunit 5 n=1 Tax=Ceratosolen solmsi marchali TaxID=326594 RepID=A0AAJ6VMJ7_9HYME|nr:PREDICTED: replication factor C subunit 5 isoform X2 [Ceratosolen solmsi marchali]
MSSDAMQVTSNLPWVEKYRPSKLCDLISHEEILQTINKFIDEDQFPHLLLYGPPGTGKTTTILACAKKLYTPQQFNSMVLELNASDDRGIGIVRGQILSFASTKTIYKSGFKLIILDEADAMTTDAQNALRRIIEKYTDNARFCIICNYLSKIIPALQSRCTKFRFGPLASLQILPRLEYVIKEENVTVTEDGKQALITLSGGDMRRVINVLQSTWLAFGCVNEVNVYSCVAHPLPIDIKNIINWLLNESYEFAYNNLKTKKGLALQDILTEIQVFVNKIEFPDDILIDLIIKMAEIEKRVISGCNEAVQLNSLVATFQKPREMQIS